MRLLCLVTFLIFAIESAPVGFPLVGEVRLSPHDQPSEGWLLCDGSCYESNQYPELHQVINITFGSEGPDKFCVPNLTGKTPRFLTSNIVGDEEGDDFHLLTVSEMPDHNHTINISQSDGNTVNPSGAYPARNFPTSSQFAFYNFRMINSTITQDLIDIRQPFMNLMFYIAYKGVRACECNGRLEEEYLILASSSLEPSCKSIINATGEGVILAGDDQTECPGGECGSDDIILSEFHLPPHGHEFHASMIPADNDSPVGSIMARGNANVYTTDASEMWQLSRTTSNTGNGKPMSVQMKSISMNLVVAQQSIEPSCTETGTNFLGEIRIFSDIIPGDDWILCDGRNFSETADPGLHDLLQGTPFTINTPDLRFRVPVGTDSIFNVGKIGGNIEFPLLESHLPAHSHGIPATDAIADGDIMSFAADTQDVYISQSPNTILAPILSSNFENRNISVVQRTKTVFFYMYQGIAPPTSPDPSVAPSPSTTATNLPTISPSRSATSTISLRNSPIISIPPSNSLETSPLISPTISLSNSPSNSPSSFPSSSPSSSSSTSLSPSKGIPAAPIPEDGVSSSSRSPTASRTKFPSFGPTPSSDFEQVITYYDEGYGLLGDNLPIIGEGGEIIGTVSNIIVPGTTLVIELNPGAPPAPTEMKSPTVDITLYDEFGTPITSFNEDIEICMKSSSQQNDLCLSFWDIPSGNWKCEDPCLEDGPKTWRCGKTRHLTNFAILLSGNGHEDKCKSDSIPTLFWISLACGIFCIIFVLFSVVLIHFRYVFKKWKVDKEFIRIETTVSTRNNSY